MSTLAASVTVREAVPVFDREQLASLARTYGGVPRPVWIRDSADRCVYQNPSAARTSLSTKGAVSFDILDHRGRIVGTLATFAL